MSASLRPYADTDFDPLLGLTVEVFGPFFEDSFRPVVGEAIFGHQHGGWREDYRRQLTGLHDPDRHKHVVVAEATDGSIVGYVAWESDLDRRHGHVEIVAVRPGGRRTGLATTLCEHAFAAMREDGVEMVELGTGGDPFHAPARELYESLGMTGFPVTAYFKML